MSRAYLALFLFAAAGAYSLAALPRSSNLTPGPASSSQSRKGVIIE
jgi:hypothetical protein